jgi:hypothetical protein
MATEFIAELERLGHLIQSKEWSTLEASVASWVAEDRSLRADVEAAVQEMASEWDMDTASAWPSGVEVGTNPLDVDGLRAIVGEELSASVKQDAFVGYGCITLLASEDEELDAFADVWIVLVRDGDTIKVGYYNLEDPD